MKHGVHVTLDIQPDAVGKFLKHFVFVPLLLAAIVLTGWNYGREFLSKEQRASAPAEMMDQALAFGKQYARPVISPFAKLLRPLTGRFFHQDYTADIHVISVAQLEGLLEAAREREFQVILVYFYSIDCAACSVNYSDINRIAASFDKTRLFVLAVAEKTTPQELSDYFNINGGLPGFKPLILQDGDEAKLPVTPYFADADFGKTPAVLLIDKDGRTSRLQTGVVRGDTIAAKVYELVK